jgi:hypothetical protein
MPIRERRSDTPASPTDLHARLNPRQQGALASLERMGWSLAFVRQVLFQQPAAVVRDSEGKRYAVLDEDGTINERHGLKLREQ